MIEADILKLFTELFTELTEVLWLLAEYLFLPGCILYLKIKQVKAEKFYSHFTTDIENKNETNTYVKSMDWFSPPSKKKRKENARNFLSLKFMYWNEFIHNFLTYSFNLETGRRICFIYTCKPLTWKIQYKTESLIFTDTAHINSRSLSLL